MKKILGLFIVIIIGFLFMTFGISQSYKNNLNFDECFFIGIGATLVFSCLVLITDE